jgi:hypothetical protein
MRNAAPDEGGALHFTGRQVCDDGPLEAKGRQGFESPRSRHCRTSKFSQSIDVPGSPLPRKCGEP